MSLTIYMKHGGLMNHICSNFYLGWVLHHAYRIYNNPRMSWFHFPLQNWFSFRCQWKYPCWRWLLMRVWVLRGENTGCYASEATLNRWNCTDSWERQNPHTTRDREQQGWDTVSLSAKILYFTVICIEKCAL